jgi:TM2 domain-containing membrane protein YozV
MTAPAALLDPARKYCQACAAVLDLHAPACPRCGAAQLPPPARTRRSKTAAALLALFLGGLGVHKFYLGRWGWGIVYLLFCWTSIPLLLGLVEFFVLLVMSDEAFASKYG